MELKNDIQLRGTLKSVDQYLNIKLDDISVVEELKYPHMVRLKASTHTHWHLAASSRPDPVALSLLTLGLRRAL